MSDKMYLLFVSVSLAFILLMMTAASWFSNDCIKSVTATGNYTFEQVDKMCRF